MPLVNHDTASELIRVLAYSKSNLTVDGQHELLADYLPWTRPHADASRGIAFGVIGRTRHQDGFFHP
ncbi:MAG: hypothetical protein ACREPF_09730 [Rhodanobacteraceae bacterium]